MHERQTAEIGWIEPGSLDVEVVVFDLSEDNFGDRIAEFDEPRDKYFRRKEHYDLEQLQIRETASE